MESESVRQLYDRYVSTFKPENATLTAAELAHYYQWCNARYLPFLKDVPKSAPILEIGCGHGRMLQYLHQKGFQNVIGIDISLEQIELATKSGLNAECADVFEYLHGTEGAFDCIIAIDVVEHFTKQELLRLFDLISRSLTRNGMLLLQTVNGEGLFPGQIIYGDLTHETILTPGSMKQLLTVSGFRTARFAECAPVANGVTGIVRSMLWRAIRFGADLARLIEVRKTQDIWTENFICSAKK